MAAKYLDGINFDSPSAGFQGTLKVRDTEARAMIQDNTNNITSNTAAIQNLQGRTATIEGEQVTQNVRLDGVEAKNEQQDTRLTAIEGEQVTQNSRLNAVEDKNTQQDGRLDAIEAEQVVQNGRLTAVEDKNTQQDAQIGALIAKDAEQDGRLDAAEADIVSLDGRMDTAEADIDAIEAKDILQDAQIADLDDRVAASTYEAGIGIYFGQGVKHTNINVDDELIDQINQNTIDIQILYQRPIGTKVLMTPIIDADPPAYTSLALGTFSPNITPEIYGLEIAETGTGTGALRCVPVFDGVGGRGIYHVSPDSSIELHANQDNTTTMSVNRPAPIWYNAVDDPDHPDMLPQLNMSDADFQADIARYVALRPGRGDRYVLPVNYFLTYDGVTNPLAYTEAYGNVHFTNNDRTAGYITVMITDPTTRAPFIMRHDFDFSGTTQTNTLSRVSLGLTSANVNNATLSFS